MARVLSTKREGECMLNGVLLEMEWLVSRWCWRCGILDRDVVKSLVIKSQWVGRRAKE